VLKPVCLLVKFGRKIIERSIWTILFRLDCPARHIVSEWVVLYKLWLTSTSHAEFHLDLILARVIG